MSDRDGVLIEALALALFCRVYGKRDPAHPDHDAWCRELLKQARQRPVQTSDGGIVIDVCLQQMERART
jgi:hypothetical protein